jgi:hypothetical protein
LKEPAADSCEFRKSVSPASDLEGATGGDSDEDYCKLATNRPDFDRNSGEVDSEGYLVPNIVGELDSEGYLKAKSSSGESAGEQDKTTAVPPPVLVLPDHDYGSSSSSDDSDDEDSYAKVSHQEPILGPGGYVKRNESPRSTPTRTFTPIEQGPGGYCTISPAVSPQRQRSQENLSGNQELPILNIRPNVTNVNGIDPLPPFTQPGPNSSAVCPPVYVQPPNSPPTPVLNGTVSNRVGNFGLINSQTPHIGANGYVQHPDPVVLGQEPLNFPRHLNGCLGILGEYDSEDDSSTTLSDSGHHSGGGFPQSLRGMPVSDGYVQRSDQCQEQDVSHPGYTKNTDTSSAPNHSESYNPNTVHSRPNCNSDVPNHSTPNGYGSNCSEPPALILAPHSFNSNNSNSNVSDYVQSVSSFEPSSAEADVNNDNSQSCATLHLNLGDQQNEPEMQETRKGPSQMPSEQSNTCSITSGNSLSSPQSNGYVDHSVLMDSSEPPCGDQDTNMGNLQGGSSEEKDEKKIVVNASGYVTYNAMNV